MNSEEVFNYNVSSRQSFIEFLSLLHRYFIEHPDKWENNNLASYLESLSDYADEIQGYYNNTNQSVNADEPSWRVFADIFRGAIIYE